MMGANQPLALSEILTTNWDAIVIGTGIGGGTLGYALAKAGQKVLFVEKGVSKSSEIQGDFPENIFAEQLKNKDKTGNLKYAELLYRSARTTTKLTGKDGTEDTPFVPLLGSGSGGSSALYGMTMERLFPADFKPQANYPDATDANLPESWPIEFEELLPFYIEAESLYRVKAGLDPRRTFSEERGIASPPAYSPANQELHDHLKAQGLDVYHQPMACEYKPNCKECIGYLCDQKCKGDSNLHCLTPAINEYGAVLLEACEVVRIHEHAGSICHIECNYQGKVIALSGANIFLAAGAIHTPALLLASKSSSYPTGLANASDMVGRNFMRHYYEYFFVKTKVKVRPGDLQKQLAFNDLYQVDGEKFGTVQSFGPLVPVSIIVGQLLNDLKKKSNLLAKIAGLASPILEKVVYRMFDGRLALCAMMEDLPYKENRIELNDNNEIELFDQVNESQKLRLKKFQGLLKDRLKPYHFIHNSAAENYQVLGHQCGTCRFGDDPSISVLDRNNKAHGIDNLYVVDASFFPSSGGTNPSLTIAANALRVAEHVLAKQ